MDKTSLAFAPKKGRTAAKLIAKRKDAGVIYKALGKMAGVSLSGSYLRIPAEPRVYDLLVSKVGLVPSQGAIDWYEEATLEEKRFAQLIIAPDAEIDHPSAAKLRPYQRVDAHFVNARQHALLSAEMGLGKTAEAIVGIELSKKTSAILVVCPNAVKYQWEDEIHRWSSNGEDTPTTVVEYARIEEQWKAFTQGWFILNYNNLRAFSTLMGEGEETRGPNRRFTTRLARSWDWAVFDEAHFLKNSKTNGYSVAKSVDSWGSVLLTGTPMGNDVSELWALLNILYPKEFSSFWRFYEMYVDYTIDYFGRRQIIGPKNTDLLRKELSTRMIQRKKSEVATDLPPKSRVRLDLNLTAAQLSAYKRAMNEWMIDCDHGKRVLPIANSLSMLTRLRQIVSTPANFDMPDDSTKTRACVELIKGTEQKAVVFTCYRKTALAVARRLEEAGIHGGLLMGGIPVEERQKVIDALNSGKIQVIVATIKAGGTGLNLQAASIAIFIDKEWNPLEQNQAENRIHRIGQSLPVTIYDLLCPGTVDDVVEAILEKKIAMTDAVLSEALVRAANAVLHPPKVPPSPQ